ncbi:MAG: SDR family oxidoreductase [Opitutales bacterium]|nr:SDR family oxidoreductase [Opitutales bacterium]MCH8541095.1 SDR family oxidoreductase [Opitutales bacterium]
MSKTILLTGASRGLGQAIGRQILQKGWSLVTVSRGGSPVIEEWKKKYPGMVSWVAQDLEEVEVLNGDFFGKLFPEGKEVHGFVNNAALAYDDLATNLQLPALDRMMKVNVYAPMLLTREVLRRMLLHKTKGSLVHLSSVAAHTGYKGLSMYGASKAALEGFSKNIAREWGRLGIRSNCVVAGYMNTDMTASLTPEQKTRIYERTALKAAVSVESVASFIVYLLSDESHSLTGQNLPVDAGTL